MKFGMRKPSVKRSIKARTTGRAKRAVKKAVIPGYGKKGIRSSLILYEESMEKLNSLSFFFS